MAWVMTTKKRGTGIDVFIGGLRVARIKFNGETALLIVLKSTGMQYETNDGVCSQTFELPGIKAALKQMHNMLNNPPEE